MLVVMRLFKGQKGVDPFAAGVQGRATIERVAPARIDDSRGRRKLFVVLRFVDPQGTETCCERELWKYNIPTPGDSYEAAFLPGEMETSFDYRQEGWQALDPSVRRGWSAGVFELELLGTHVPPLGDPGRNAERELFRQGRRAEAEVVGWDDAGGFAGQSFEYPFTLTLRADDREHQVQVRADEPHFVPDVGDRIQVAISDDGSDLALDTDERFYGPPCRVLVWSTPSEVARRRARAAGGAAPAGGSLAAEAQVAALEAMRDRGQITAEQFEAMKARLGG